MKGVAAGLFLALSGLTLATAHAQVDDDAELQRILDTSAALQDEIAELESTLAKLGDSASDSNPLEPGSGVPVSEHEIVQNEIAQLTEREQELMALLSSSEPTPTPSNDDPGNLTNDNLVELMDRVGPLRREVVAARSELVLKSGTEVAPGAEETASGFPADRLDEARNTALQLRESVVLLSVEHTGGLGGTATGFVIAPDLIVTNSHNVTSGPALAVSVEITTIEGRTVTANIIDHDPNRDIALLRLDESLSVPILEWGDSSALEVGDPLLTVGNPGRMSAWVMGAGVVTGIDDTNLATANGSVNQTVVESTLPGMPGSSGSPVFNMAGEVVAVMYGANAVTDTTDPTTRPITIHSQMAFLPSIATATASDVASQIVDEFLGGG